MATVIRHLPAILIGFVFGAAVMCGVFAYTTQRVPPTPVLRPPVTIKVTLHPWSGAGKVDGMTVDIPPKQLDFVFRLLTPAKFFEGGVHDFIVPIVAEVIITHENGKETTVLVRDCGKNPAVVSLDGRSYFYARNEPDIHAGAAQLIALVHAIKHNKERKQHQTEMENQLAMIEPDLEKDLWSIKLKLQIRELSKMMEQADRVDLLQLNPRESTDPGATSKLFHDHEVLFEVRVDSQQRRREVTAFLANALHWNEGRKGLCFDPNHGMRIVSGDRTLEFLICFSCWRVRIFENNKMIGELALGFTDTDHPIEKFLAEKKRDKQNP